MKKFFILISALFIISCSTDNSNNSENKNLSNNTIAFPSRFHGSWYTQSGLNAHFETNKMILDTPYDGTLTRTEGEVTEDNETTLFKSTFPNNESIVLLLLGSNTSEHNDDLLGITFYRNNHILISTNFKRD